MTRTASAAGAVPARPGPPTPPFGSPNAPASVTGWLGGFAAAYALVVFAPTFLVVGLGPFLTAGDLLEVAGSFLLVGLAWVLYDAIRSGGPSAGGRYRSSLGVLAAGSMLYLCATGMHVAANAVARQAGDPSGSPDWPAAHFFDEVLSHLLASAGLLAISAALLAAASRRRAVSSPTVLLSAALFGVAWFVDAVEGGTVELVLPISALALGGMLMVRRRAGAGLGKEPVRLFYVVALSVALGLFLAWWVWRGGFPEFSELGWI